MTTPSSPIVNQPNKYINGFALSWLSTTTLSVTAGSCRDSTNTNDIVYKGPLNLLNQDGISENTTVTSLPTTITINGAVNGLNGLDTGALANTTFYAVYVIADSYSNNVTGAIISTNVTTPTLPAGYDMFRRIGFVKTDGAAHFLPFWQSTNENGTDRTMWYDAPISVLGATAAAAFTAQSLAAAVPAGAVGGNNIDVILQADLLPNAAANFVAIRPTGSAAAAGNIKMSGDVGAVNHFGQLRCVAALAAGVVSIDWLTDAVSTVALTVAGYVDSL